ncbi:MAG: sugar transferase [Salibacteraceae bacterium]|nr:sugar transferase [Salibacteraceae bacterium]|tara:strand:- start:35904 stop:36491 length:588 start_codon:yes stop_codon:yes gene_type:complete
MIRLADIIFSLFGILVLSPLFLLVGLLVKIDTKGPILFNQQRVGRWSRDFFLHKIRTMKVDSEALGQLTVGGRDPRITGAGYILRKYKLDELPQLFNVLKGEMSLVGPRPEVRRYVEEYNSQQKTVLNVKPGITDYASISFVDENDILAASDDPEKAYIEEVMPEKLKLNQKFIENPSFGNYVKVIFLTGSKIIR